MLFLTSTSNAQINVTGGQTAQQLAEILAGPNITVTNAVLIGGGVASGSFAGTNSDIGFDSGVILSTGNITEASGPNNAANVGANLNNAGTAEMTALAGVNTFDAITLEFDFEVQSSTIQFNYVFASEEYPEFAPPNNSGFNDVFAFYISGPGITGQENIALVPNSTSAVAINNINPVTNSQYYFDNAGGNDVQFDGFTTILEASRGNLTPCQVYRLRLVIADAGDGVYSSAVFLQENSLIQGTVNVQTQTINADDIALEGCIPASFTFSYDEISNQDQVINFTVGGTAVNGVDYQFVDSSMTIVAGDTSATIYINAFSDGITEGQESVWIIYQPAACAPFDTAYLFIDDAQPIDFTLDGIDLNCFGNNSGQIQVNASGGFPPYTYEVTYPDASVGSTQTNPITGLAAGTYSVQVTDSYGCQADALVIGGVFDADTTFLPDVPGGTVTTYDAPLDIQGFNNGQTITDVSQIQQICLTLEHSYLGDLQIQVVAPSGEVVILKQQNGGGSCDLGEPIATGPVDGSAGSLLTDPGVGYEYCFNASPVYGTMVDESNNFTRNYTDALGNNYNDNYLPAGSYTPFEDFTGLIGADMNGTWTVQVTDQFNLDNGYIFNWYISLVGDLPDTLVTLIEPTEIVTTGFVTNSTCGASDGSIDVDIQDAAAPYTILWSNGATTEDITGIAAGTYTITVTDANGCQSNETFLVNNIGSLAISSSSTITSCFGGSDGTIDITASGGQLPYSFSWDSGQTSEDISGLTAGTYTVTMQDQIGCIISEVVVVSDAAQMIISSQSILNEECSTDNGSINISVSGGTGSYGYQWSSGQNVQDLSNLTSGIYTIDVIDGNGCTATESYTLVNDLSNCSAFCFIAVEENVIIDEDCGSGNGSLDINILDALAPVSFSWSSGATTEDLVNLTTGSYTVVATDANNCSASMTFTVNNNTGNLLISSANVSEENCGNLNGAIDITISGGAMPYSYSWSNGATSEDVANLAAGSYTVTVTDGNGCQTTNSYTVANNAGSLSATASIVPETCTGGNGSIGQTVTGGNGVLTYSWDSGQITEDISGLSTGTYVATVTDETGCFIENTYFVGQTTGDISLIGSNITNETCGNVQGAINVTLTGANLIYSWSNGAITEDVSGVSAGNYTLQVTNAQGCVLDAGPFSVINTSGTLGVSTQLITEEVCGNANGSINMNIAGGLMPYTFSWSNGATDEDIFNLTAGTYSVTVTDANGCSESRSVVVGANSGTLSIQNAILTDEVCGDNTGAIDLIPNGGSAPLTFAWSNGASSEDLSTLATGTYTVIITDQNGCQVNESYFINNQANSISYTSSVTNEICTNGQGEISLNTSGGTGPYTYAWSNGGTTSTVSGLSSMTYSVVITDNLGCSIQSEVFTIGNTANGMTASAAVTDAACSNNGSIDLTINGGANPLVFAWSNGSSTEDITNLVGATYTYTVTDANSCEVSGSATVIETNGAITYTFSTVSEICGNGTGSIDLVPAGGSGPYTFLWSNGATTEDISGLSLGIYSVTITDQNGCSITTSNIQISNSPGSLSIANVVATDETCSNGLGNIDISITGGSAPITFSWSNGASTEDISNLSSGTYSVTVTDQNGCDATTQAVINSSAGSLAITQPVVTSENCSNGQGSVNITITGAANPISYQWSNGASTEDLSNLSEGTYSVTVTDGNGCTTTGSYIVTNNGTSLAISGASITDEYCGSGSGSITVTVSGGASPYNYSWNNGATTALNDNLSSGTYNITVTDASGCQAINSYFVANNIGNLTVSGVVTDENCGDDTGAIDITTTGGNLPLTFDWDSGQTSEDITALSENTYNLLVTDDFGCTANYSGTVNNISGGLSVSVTTVTDENCGQSDGGVDVLVVGTGIVSTVWDSGQTTEDLTGISAGTYTVTVTNNVGCTASASATVSNQTGTLAITFSNVGDENCQNGQGFVDVEVSGTGPYTYLWSDGQTTQDAINLSANTYSVLITDGLGCELNASYQVVNSNATNLSSSEIITDAICTTATGAIDVTVAGGVGPFIFSWLTGEATEDLSGVIAGTYEVTITDNANCQVTQTIVVDSQNSGLGFTNLNVTDESCGQGDGQIVIFTGGTADDYYLDGVNNGGPTINNLAAGTYNVSISDNQGCTADTNITVGAVAPFTIADVSNNESCADAAGNIDITVTGGGPVDFLWSTGATTEDISGLAAGTYTITVSQVAGGCSIDYDVIIGNDVTFEITSTTSDDYCQQTNGVIDQTVTVGSGLTYSWSTGATTEDLNGLVAGNYSVTITDPSVGGCVETINYVVGSSNNGMTAGTVNVNEICSIGNGEIDLTMSGGSGAFDYSWDNGAITEDITGLSSGTFTVTVTDQGDNCMITETYTLTNTNTVFNGSGTVVDATCSTCSDGEIDVTLSTATTYTYVWDNGGATEDLMGLNPGTYILVATSAEGCDTTIVFDVLNTVSLLENEILNMSINVQPNPASLNFNVIVELPNGQDGMIVITDALGKLIHEVEVAGEQELVINSSKFAPGTYFIALKSRKFIKMERVVIYHN